MIDASPSRRVATFGLFAMLALVGTGRADDCAAGPLSPADEWATFRLADPALRIDLVAAEPEVISPVAVAWDSDGRLYVAEMIDYPEGPTAGRIRRLEDVDGDGRYDRATVFADRLAYPTSVLPWKEGVLVAAAPDIWFLEDNDGDGRADARRVVLTGFGEGNQQLRVNGLTWGLDNWVYGANGRSDGLIRRPGDPDDRAIALRRRDFRFRPDTGEFQPVAGFSQFGLPRDDRGDRFPSWNTTPIRHVVIEDGPLNRNPHLAGVSSVASILDPADPGRIFAISPAPATFNRESVAYFNASCGPTIYRGDTLGDAYRGDAFACESLLNLVHRRELIPEGPTFVAKRAPTELDREFLASTDPAFRPVNLATGPDGNLYVVDFYRELVEHPQFVTADLRKSIEFRRWNDRGRIWRVGRIGVEGSPRPHLSKADSGSLVALLGHPNGWWRDTAQRLLVERRDPAAVPALSGFAKSSPAPLGRLHAIWTLEGLGALDDPTLASALRDASPDVRRDAIRLSEGRPASIEALIALADDHEIRVRLQAAIALGDLDGAAATGGLARIATRDVGDPWMRAAILSGLRDTASPFLDALLDARPNWLDRPEPAQAYLLEQVASIIGARCRPVELQELAARLVPGPGQGADLGRIALLAGLLDGLARGDKLAKPGEDIGPAIAILLDRAARLVVDPTGPPEGRARAIRLLARRRPEVAAKLVPGLLLAEQPEAVRSASARAIAEVGSPALASAVLDRWADWTAATLREVLAAVLTSTPLATCLVEAIERDAIAIAELDPTAREALGRLPDPALLARASTLLAKAAPPDRGEVLRTYQASLIIPGDTGRGGQIFARDCTACHIRRGEGRRVGPDLSGIGGRPASALLQDSFDPNRNVAPDFACVILVTTDGRVASGLLASETANGVTIRQAAGVEQTFLRPEIAELRPTGRSLMPEGLEQALGPQGVADLLAYLKQP